MFITSTMNSECLILYLKNYSFERLEKYTFLKKYSLEYFAFWDINLRSPLQALFSRCFLEIPFLAYLSTLKVKAKYTSEDAVDFQPIVWYIIPDDRILHNHSCELGILIFHCIFHTYLSLVRSTCAWFT
jgi:hypothetical protein